MSATFASTNTNDATRGWLTVAAAVLLQLYTMDEMKNNVETLSRLNKALEEARDELEQINIEEGLVEFELSQFPILQQLFVMKDPYEKLWSTALNFANRSDEWLTGG